MTKLVRRRALRKRRVTEKFMHDGRPRGPAVHALKKFLRAYGSGGNGNLARREFAQRLGTSEPYLVQLGLGYRRASLEMAINIERATHGLVRAEALYPSFDWAYLARRHQVDSSGSERERARA